MRAQELRIGNFVSVKTTQNEFDIVKEIGDGGSKRGDYIRLKDVHSGVWLDFKGDFLVKPIPLTEEWLVRLGFKTMRTNKDSGYKELGLIKKGFHIMFSIECNCNPECFVENIGIDIEHVHQLQNLCFVLTGQELELKNTLK